MDAENLKANTFMPTLLTYLRSEQYRLIRELEGLEEQSAPYKYHIETSMIERAQELAQLHWTEHVLLQIYDADLHFLPKKARNIDEIRERLENGEKAVDLAEEYGVSESTISRYKLGIRRAKKEVNKT